MNDKELITAAFNAMEKAYAPYSAYLVARKSLCALFGLQGRRGAALQKRKIVYGMQHRKRILYPYRMCRENCVLQGGKRRRTGV